MTTATPQPTRIPTLALMRRLFAYRPWLFAGNFLLWAAFGVLPAIFGYTISQVFDRLTEVDRLRRAGPGAGTGDLLSAAWIMVGLFALARFTRFGLFWPAFRGLIEVLYSIDALLRRNLLAHLLLARGARRLPDTPAEAVSRFRDDVEDVAGYTDRFLDAGGLILYATVAVTLMWRVDTTITLVVTAPLLLMIVFVQRLVPTIRAYRRRMREATARVTDFVGETFGAVGAVKLAARESGMVAHLAGLGETRRKAALRDVLLTELIRGVNMNMIYLGTGFVLLLGAARVRAGALSIGDLILFFALLPRLTSSMTFFGDMIATHRRTGVSFERMRRLLQDAPPEQMVEHHDVHLRGELPAVPPAVKAAPLEEVRVEGLTALYDNGRGISGASFTVRRGEFVVVTGRIGSGKTTLLRALLGLIPRDSGRIWWNGEAVEDPASFFVPPRSAYTAQLPQLFSDTLRENVLMGEADTDLNRALGLAVMDADLAQLGHGLNTQVGARGVKLSGGQVQRTAVARMLAREADLLVFDDVSSALDAETERQLWVGLFADRDATCLVVSHRRAALQRADRILVLQNGVVADEGSLSDLLARSPEMRALWAEEEGEAAD